MPNFVPDHCIKYYGTVTYAPRYDVGVGVGVVKDSTALAETDLRALQFGPAELGVDKVIGALSVRGRPRPREREGPTASVGGCNQ